MNRWLITDTTGDSGTVAVRATEVARSITPWFPEAPAEVTDGIAALEDALRRGEPADDLAVALGVTVALIPDTWSADCFGGHHQSCGGYDEDGDLCACPHHDDEEAAYREANGL